MKRQDNIEKLPNTEDYFDHPQASILNIFQSQFQLQALTLPNFKWTNCTANRMDPTQHSAVFTMQCTS